MKSGSKQSKIKTVMKEWKEGKLKSSSGDKVTNPKQAIAIALSEAGMSKNKKRGGGAIMADKKSTMGEALKKGGSLFKGKENYGEELKEAKAVKSGKISPKEFEAGEKSEKHMGEEPGALETGKKIKSGKMSPEQYAKMEAEEPEGKRGGGAIMSEKSDAMGVALRGGGAIMSSKRSTMGEALSTGGEVKGTGVAIRGFRPAKMS
jgi:hypothetical protein